MFNHNGFTSGTAALTDIAISEANKSIYTSTQKGKVVKLTIKKKPEVTSGGGSEEVTLEPEADFVLNHGDNIMAMCLDGDRIMTGGSDAKLILWSIHERKWINLSQY